MDNKQKETLLGKITKFFSDNDIPAEVVEKVEKFETVLLADGVTEVTIEPAVEMGAAIVLTSEDGTPVAAPVGEYELQDGRVVVVAEEGVVSEVREGEIAEEPMANDKPEEADKVKRIIERIESEKIFSRLETLESRLEETEKENKFLKEENETLTDNFNELKTFSKEMLEEVAGLVGAKPSKEPVKEEKKNPLAQFRSNEDPLKDWLAKQNKEENDK